MIVIDLLFILDTFSDDITLDTLENSIEPLIVNVLENDQGNIALGEDLVHFQQDRAPPHYADADRHWLDTNYSNKWIGIRGHIEWLTRSPDLSRHTFFSMGYLKSVVYKTQPASLGELLERITHACYAVLLNFVQSLIIGCKIS